MAAIITIMIQVTMAMVRANIRGCFIVGLGSCRAFNLQLQVPAVS